MMTAVDTNILLDVLIPDAPFGAASQQSLDTALQQGTLVLNEVVYTQVCASFGDDVLNAGDRYVQILGEAIRSDAKWLKELLAQLLAGMDGGKISHESRVPAGGPQVVL